MSKKPLPMRAETADPVMKIKHEVPHLKAVLLRSAEKSPPEWRDFWLDLAHGKKHPRRPHVDKAMIGRRMTPEDQAAHDRYIEMMARAKAAPKTIVREPETAAPPPLPPPKLFAPRPPRPGIKR